MRHLIRNLLIALAGLIVLAVLALATPPGHAVVARLIARAASTNGLTVSIEGLSGWPPFWLRADKVTLADADGPFAEIDNLAVDIHPTALLRGVLALKTISAERVSVERQPHLAGGGSSGAALPFVADTASVARLELGSGLAAGAATLSLTGSVASSANGGLTAEVAATRIDGRTGMLKATVTRASSATPLTADVTVAEDADGVLAGLIGRSSAPAYSLTAKTRVDGGAIDGTVALQSNGNAHFTGQFKLSPAGSEGQRLVATGSGDLAELVPPEYADLVSGPINLAVDADWATAPGTTIPSITIRQGTLTTGNVRAEASGALSTATASLAFTLDIAKADGGSVALPLATVAQVRSVALKGTVAPTDSAIRLQLSGNVADLKIDTATIPGLGLSLAIEAPKDNPLAGKTLPFALRAEASALETPTGRIESVAGTPLILTANGSIDATSAEATADARLDIAGGTVTFTGAVATTGAKGALTANFADLKPLSPIAGRPIAGAILAKAEGTFAAESALKVTATANGLDPGDETLTRLLAGKAAFAATLAGGAERGIVLSEVSAKSAALDASGNMAVAPGTIDGAFDARIKDLATLADASSGAAVISVKVSGERTRPMVAATVTVPSGTLLDQPLADAVVHFDGTPKDEAWAGVLTLQGSFAGKPLSGTAATAIDTAGLLTIPDVDLGIGDNRIKGSATRTTQGPLAGSLDVSAPDLHALASLALVNASGSGIARIDFKPDGERQSLAVSFTGSDIAAAGTAASTIAGDISVADVFGAPQLSGQATARDLTIGSTHLDTAELTATPNATGATQFGVKAAGRDIDLTGSGSLAGATGAQTVRVDALSGSAFGLPVKLNAPVVLNLGGGPLGIAGASLALGGGTVRIDGTVSPGLDLTIVTDKVAASVANGFSPSLGAEGTISGRATVTGKPAAPMIVWTAAWSGLRLAQMRSSGLPPLALTASGNATLTGTSLSARLSGGGLTLSVNGQVPFQGRGLSVKAAGTVPLALLALESNRELRLAGMANLDLSVAGSLAAPAISGTADMAGATVADTNTGFGISGATGRIAFDGQRATIAQISGHLVQGGDVTVAGTVAFASDGLPADLTVRVTKGRYADGKVINTTFSADLAVKGPLLGNGTISGKVDLGRTEIQLPDRLAGSATAIDVRHVNTPPGFKPPKARESATTTGGHAGGALGVNVALSGNSGLTVRGFGIDAEFGGTLQLTGTSGDPQTAGAFQMRRGRMDLLGRRFDFQSGTLTFDGDLVPVLDFVGTTTTSSGTVTLTVSGRANDPKISFTSSPSLPDEEILSRLLFDQSVGSLSPLQAAQLVDALAQLTGALGGGGLFDRIRQATGLDDLDIRQSATGGTTVGAAKRINDKLRVGVEAGGNSSSGRVVIDLDITKNLKARGEGGQGGEGKVGLIYEQEY